MALLIVLAFLTQPPSVQAVLYDLGDSRNSVAVVENTLLQAGDVYEHFEVIDFAPDAIILKDLQTFDDVKWLREGKADDRLLERANQLFVVKQMRAIHAAQVKFFEAYRGYAPDIETLLEMGFLPGGFDRYRKQGYFFEIQEVGETRRQAMSYERQPIFLAEAIPDKEGEPYFSIDQLGQVRYAATPGEVRWGPVWEYSQHEDVPSRFIGLATADR